MSKDLDPSQRGSESMSTDEQLVNGSDGCLYKKVRVQEDEQPGSSFVEDDEVYELVPADFDH